MKTLYYIIICTLLIQSFNIQAEKRPREFDKKLERAEELFEGGNYKDALKEYLAIYKNDTDNAQVCYKLGSCYLKGNDNWKALFFLNKAVNVQKKSSKAELPVSVYRMLGDVYHLISEFDLAIAYYQQYKTELKLQKDNDDAVATTDKKIRICSNAKELMRHPVPAKVRNLGGDINSAWPDYSPRLSADQCIMIFTSKRPENTGGFTYDGGQYFEDIYVATRANKNAPWSKAENLGWPINTVGNEAAVAISADAQEIIIYKDDLGDGNLYSSQLKGSKWTMPQKLNSNINSKHWEPCAYISADGRSMYFVSDRPGGFGGTDIYRSEKKPGGDWGPAVNLGPSVNTPDDEYSPFIHPDGKTLYFSSKGHNTMGGYDVFYSNLLDPSQHVWSQPSNVGYPVNSTGDDVFYTVSPDKQSAYYTSFREGGFGEKDNYMITFSDMNETPALSLLKGTVDTGSDEAKDIKITVIDNATGEVAGVYHANAQSGKYMLVLSPGSHNISYEADGRVFYSEHLYVGESEKYKEEEKNVKLAGIAPGTRIMLNNIFFDFDQWRLSAADKAELSHVLRFMRLNPGIKLEVTGYADAKGKDAYNYKLSVERALAVVNYLVSNGIEKDRLVASGRGEEEAKKESVSQKGVNAIAADRRVELKILEVK